jgi:hypothetical protein
MSSWTLILTEALAKYLLNANKPTRKQMTRSELTLLTECGHDLAAKVALAIIAAAQVGPCNMELQVDMDTVQMIAIPFGIDVISTEYRSHLIHEIRLTFMEVDAVIYARVQR